MSASIFGRAILCLGSVAGYSFGSPAHGAGDIARGALASRACVACHSFAPGRHLTGPSLAGIWGRRAGTAAGFSRYSDALKRSELVWDAQALDAWLHNPAAVVPGNTMLFDGISQAGTRADLLAYLPAVSEGRVSPPDRRAPNLKLVDTSRQVTAVRYCGDTYRVVTADGKQHQLWEFNLRFKTDGSADGPSTDKPVIVGTGMQGDRAAIVFSRPEEISTFVRRECP